MHFGEAQKVQIGPRASTEAGWRSFLLSQTQHNLNFNLSLLTTIIHQITVIAIMYTHNILLYQVYITAVFIGLQHSTAAGQHRIVEHHQHHHHHAEHGGHHPQQHHPHLLHHHSVWVDSEVPARCLAVLSFTYGSPQRRPEWGGHPDAPWYPMMSHEIPGYPLVYPSIPLISPGIPYIPENPQWGLIETQTDTSHF